MRPFMPDGQTPGPYSIWQKEVYADDQAETAHGGMFGMGEPNEAYAQYFKGNSYLKPLTEPGRSGLLMANVTF